MIYDIHTKNISFLKVSKLLRNGNVKNNKEMLILYDESLSGVDVRDRNLTTDQKLAIYRECCRNYWYFIREVVRIPADGAEISYELNLGNFTLSYLKLRNKNFILILPRQHGKTMGEVVFDVWNLCFVTKNTNVVYLNKGKTDAVKNLKLFRDVKNLLPDWMLEMFISDAKKDIDNQENKLMAKRNNTLKVVSPGSDPDAADKAGRGLTTSSIVFDEFAFMKYNQITYEACLPAYKRASENAKKYGSPYGITITTTPNNLDVEAGAFCYSMIQQAARWNLECFDLSDSELNTFISDNSQNDFLFVQYSYLELGRDDAWLQEMIRQCNGNRAKIKREILLDWPKSMDTSVFNEEQLDKIHEFIKTACCHIFALNKRFSIDFYETPDLNRNYILSCDVSGGLSKDNSVINIIDPEDFRIVGDFRNSKIDTDSFRELIQELMTIYFRNAYLVIEKNSYGLNIIQTLMKNPQIEPRMYRDNKETLGEKKTQNGFVVKQKTKTVSYGVDTNTVTRKQMIDMLPELVDTEYDKFVSPHLYEDLATLERKKTGKIEHSASGHDDSLMAYLIFRWAVYYGRCFKDKFGISPIPSRMNVKVVSSSEGINRIETIIQQAMTADTTTNFSENQMYNSLLNQSMKLKEDNEAGQQMNMFLRIANLNK